VSLDFSDLCGLGLPADPDDLSTPNREFRQSFPFKHVGFRLFRKFCTLLSRTGESDRQLLSHMARKMGDQKPVS
jgi:hypothetical protein